MSLARWGRAGLSVGLVALVIQLAALVRTLSLTREYGASVELDTFYFVNTCAFAVFNIISSGATLVMIPTATRGLAASEVRAIIRRLYHLAGLVSLCVATVVLALALLGLGPTGSRPETMLALFALLIAGQQVRVATSVWNAILQANGRVETTRWIALLPALLPTATVAVNPDLYLLCLSILVSNLLEAVLNHRLGRAHTDESGTASSSSGVWSQLWPVMMSSSLFQAQTIALTWAAGLLGSGTVTVFASALQLTLIPQVLIVQNVLLLTYPWISRASQSSALVASRRQLTGLAGATAGLGHICVVGMVALGGPVISTLFVRGDFLEDSAYRVFVFSTIMILSLPFAVVRDYCYRVLYAAGKSVSASRNSMVVIAVTMALFAVSVPWLGPLSIPASLAVSTVVSSGFALWRVREEHLRPNTGVLLRRQTSYILATGASCAAAILVPQATSSSVAGDAVAIILFLALVARVARKDVRDAVGRP
jgi:O-antigen/teichoic acid export membrane protein